MFDHGFYMRWCAPWEMNAKKHTEMFPYVWASTKQTTVKVTTKDHFMLDESIGSNDKCLVGQIRGVSGLKISKGLGTFEVLSDPKLPGTLWATPMFLTMLVPLYIGVRELIICKKKR